MPLGVEIYRSRKQIPPSVYEVGRLTSLSFDALRNLTLTHLKGQCLALYTREDLMEYFRKLTRRFDERWDFVLIFPHRFLEDFLSAITEFDLLSPELLRLDKRQFNGLNKLVPVGGCDIILMRF